MPSWISGGPSRTSTTAHRKWREAVMNRDSRECQLREPGCTLTATEADHIIGVKQRPDLELALSNGQAVCTSCHKRKTQREAAAARRAAKPHIRPLRESHPGLTQPTPNLPPPPGPSAH